MASAQVLPSAATTSSRKQEHLEAGKRRLEEFRKKKAAERAKKADLSASQPRASDGSQNDKQLLETERVRQTVSDGIMTSNAASQFSIESSAVVADSIDRETIESIPNSEVVPSNDRDSNIPFPICQYSVAFTAAVDTPAQDIDTKRYDSSGFVDSINYNNDQWPKQSISRFGSYTSNEDYYTQGLTSGEPVVLQPQPQTKHNNISYFSLTNSSAENSSSASGQNIYGHFGLLPSVTVSSFHEGEGKLGSAVGDLPSLLSEPLPTRDSVLTSFTSDAKFSSSHMLPSSALPETNSRRSRSSFLDSLVAPRPSSVSTFSHAEANNAGPFISNSSKDHNMDVLASLVNKETFSVAEIPNSLSGVQNSMNLPASASNGDAFLRHSLNEDSMERKHEDHFPKQDEDFAALEQHIEDLTREKFSLQRALEASRALAESLAAENSSLTESYNQQGSVVNQLKFDMERLQEEIKAQLVELQSVKVENANAQLECNAADERGRLLASEVIGLEEKALRLRSSELKLERQLENLQAEIYSYRKKVSSLEKEREDLRSTVEALQEDKKMLQGKLRKSSWSGKSHESLITKKEVSTSTEDLDSMPTTSSPETGGAESLLASAVSGITSLPKNGPFDLEELPIIIPPDQMRMIQNINTVLSELALEKDELTQALMTETSNNAKLKEANKELSRKLETQTQRLELLASQSAAAVSGIPTRRPEPRSTQDDSMTYAADEGDEVVERVLGWIMKLFPGGPSRRRTSKLI